MINSNQNQRSRSHNILQWNCRSIIRKLPEFESYLINLKIIPDIICSQETFLSCKHSPKHTGYTILRKDRCSGGAGGGVAIFVRNDIYFLQN